MTGVDKVLVVYTRDAAFIDHLFKSRDFRIEHIIFLAVAFVVGRVGIL